MFVFLVAQGATRTLTATVLPANASNRNVTWQSSDSAVATVDASGVVTGIAEGTATITVTTVDGNKTASCAVTVLPVGTVIVNVTGVSVSPTSVSMNPGNTRRLTATVSPADATFRDISWSSSDHGIATVDGTGKVTAVAAGSATITATTVGGVFTADCAVRVTSGTGGFGSGSSGDKKSGTDYTISPQYGVTWLERIPAGILADNAKRNDRDYVRTNNAGVYGARKAALLVLAGLRYEHDTMADGAVQVRVRIPKPGKAAADLLMSGWVKGDAVNNIRSIFEKWFQNKVRVIYLDQRTDWGQSVNIAARVDLTGMDTKKLYFYSYDKTANSYRRIEKPAYWIDTNGYLRFTTEYAGDIIVSEGALERK